MSRTCDVKGTRNGVVIVGPFPAIGGKVVCLSSTGGLIGAKEVVGANNEAGHFSVRRLGEEEWVPALWNERSMG